MRFSLVDFPVFVHLCLPVLSCEPAAGDTNGYDDEEEETNQKNLAGSGAGYLQSRIIFCIPHCQSLTLTYTVLFLSKIFNVWF